MTSGRETAVAVAILQFRKRVWIQRRGKGRHLADFWEFPGGKVEPGETPLQTLLREVREEVGLALSPQAPQLLLVQPFVYPCRVLRLYFYRCRLDVRPELEGGCWSPIRNLDRDRFPPANWRIIEILKSGFLTPGRSEEPKAPQ